MATGRRLLIRHGDYRTEYSYGDGPDREVLTERGRAQARDAGEKVAEILRGGASESTLAAGAGALLLSSRAPRAKETAGIVHAGAPGLDYAAWSLGLQVAGNRPGVVSNLEAWFAATIEAAGHTYDPNQDLVVVAHAPLIAQATGQDVRRADDVIEHGGVYSWDHTWNASSHPEVAIDLSLPRDPSARDRASAFIAHVNRISAAMQAGPYPA